MSQDIQQRLRPLSHNIYSYNSETRASTAFPQKNKQGTIYKGSFLSKALQPLNQEVLAFQQRIRPITTGGIAYPQTTVNRQSFNVFGNQQKPRTATYSSKQKTSQSTQMGRPTTTQERNLLDFNLVESEVYPGIYYAKNAESVPFSKCCNSPVYIELYESGTGRIMCNEKTCQMQLLTEFIINFEEGQNLWKENLVFTTNANQDTVVRRQVSKLITTGFFKHKSIVREVKKLQKSGTFKQNKLHDFYPLSTNSQDNFYQNPFLTAQEQEDEQQAYFNTKQYGLNQMNAPPEFQDLQFQTNDMNDIQQQQTLSRRNLPPKVAYINTNKEEIGPLTKLKIDQGEIISLNQKIASGLVQNSQIFNKDFKNKFGTNSTQNKWRPQSFQNNGEGNEYQLRNTFNNQAPPSIRLKSGFNKEKRNKSANQKQQNDFQKLQESKYQDEEKTLLDIKNMINDILS